MDSNSHEISKSPPEQTNDGKWFTEFIYRQSVHSIEMSELREYDRYRSRTWEFTRAVKNLPRFAGYSAEQVADEIPWGDTEFSEEEEDILSFMNEWDKVRLAPNQAPLEYALVMADAKPLFQNQNFPKYCRFLSLAGWLQELMGHDAEIYLPVRTVADLLRVDPSTISTFRRRAETDGFLVQTQKHTPTKATRHRFNCDKYQKGTATGRNNES